VMRAPPFGLATPIQSPSSWIDSKRSSTPGLSLTRVLVCSSLQRVLSRVWLGMAADCTADWLPILRVHEAPSTASSSSPSLRERGVSSIYA
jgi:hypothetical protein